MAKVWEYNCPNLLAGLVKNLPKEVAMKVAFQGEPGAYSEEASMGYFVAPETVPCETFEEIFYKR